MSTNNTTSSSGIGVLGLMFIVLFALKLIGIAPVSTWSWWLNK